MSVLYDVMEIENAIENIAAENNGEISEEMLQKLVLAQTNSLIQIESLAKYVKHLEYFQESAKKEEERIYTLRKRAENRVESIKKYLTPYIESHGKVEVGTFKISIRKSESVELDDNFNNPNYQTQVISYKTDKSQLKLDIKTGKTIEGARIKENLNLQIK